jgi:hypothetical protein
LCAAAELTPVRIGGRTLFVAEEFGDLIARHRTQAGPQP